ncbi:hypothetical protein [Streptomyces milbemycinicus]|uniref:hypothetical protein n=1 Tax=Streptomyces milbemycinicus TaxID=476552 RepID=UPI0033FFB4CC
MEAAGGAAVLLEDDRVLDAGLVQDGAPPVRPRLVVTGEVTGGRDVNDVVELDVVRVEPTG